MDSQLQEEIRLLINENLEMRETIERLQQDRSVSGASKGGVDMSLDADSSLESIDLPPTIRGGAAAAAAAAQTPEPKFMGMLRLADKDVQRVVDDLVLHLSPEALEGELPGLPAHLLFMCILYADHAENAGVLQSLLTKSMSAIKEVVIRNTTNLGVLSFWLANTFTLLCDMKQFSGDPQYQVGAEPEEQCLSSFDLQEYRMVMSDLLVQIYQTVIKHVEHQLVCP